MPAASLTPVGGEQSPTAGEARALTGAPGPERLINFVSPQLSFQISSRGMGLKSIDVKTYKTRADEPVILGAVNERLPFGTELVDSQSAIDFSVEKAADNVFVGRAKIGEMEITKTLKIDPALYAMDVSVSVKNPTPAFKGLQTTLSEPLIDPKSSTFLVPSYDRQDFFLRHDAGKTERKVISKDKGISLDEKNVGLMAFSSHYFTLAIVDSKILLPRFETRTSAGAAETTGRLIYEPINPRENFEIRFKAYAGPKSFEAMDKVDPELATVIDHGMFGVFGKPLWSLLKFCFSISGNYGLAIILMTLVVRLCVMPFNVYSFRSMKAMQRIQPQINALKERYKDDPRTMNAEVMSLMKANKANPLGGCIPVLLQLPIFFAFYQVLGQSIETLPGAVHFLDSRLEHERSLLRFARADGRSDVHAAKAHSHRHGPCASKSDDVDASAFRVFHAFAAERTDSLYSCEHAYLASPPAALFFRAIGRAARKLCRRKRRPAK